ncbi:MAG TPA: NAD(P)-dependent oxidoreductase [Burkholderiales bacterium]|nr:NAD(P)-dependent oxidoreductase [Burkholderiales bacterium]
MRKPSVGVLGLGIMGSAIAANLVRAGLRVCGYDPVAARRRALARAGGAPLGSAGEVAAGAKILLLSLPGPAPLAAVCAEIAARAAPGTVVVEMSTLRLEDKEKARRLLARRRIVLLDCPLSGTGAQARTKDLVVFASGPPAACRRLAPVFRGFARAWPWLGRFGDGMRMKLVANLLVAIHNVSAAEAFVLARRAGLDPELVLRVVGDGAGGSRMFQVRGPMMVARRYTPATMSVAMWQKDMRIIGEYAARLGAAVPLFRASAPLYRAALAQGRGRQDTAAVLAVLERASGRSGRKRRG